MVMLKLVDEYKDTGYRIVPISSQTVNYIEDNLGDLFLHMNNGQIHAISEAEADKIIVIIRSEDEVSDECPYYEPLVIDNTDDDEEPQDILKN